MQIEATPTVKTSSSGAAMASPLDAPRPDLLRIVIGLAVARCTFAVLFFVAATNALSQASALALAPVLSSALIVALATTRSLQIRLRDWHLKLIVIITAIDVVAMTTWFTQWFFETYIVPSRDASKPRELIDWLKSLGIDILDAPPVAPFVALVSLFVLLLVISWRYRTRYAITFVLVTTVFELMGMTVILRSPTQIFLQTAIFGARTAIFVIMALAIGHLVATQNRQQRALVEANAKLVRHLSTVEELSISQERNRLARELHDTLAHTLSAVSVQLEATNSQWDHDRVRARGALSQALTTTRLGLKETRRALVALRASPLEDLGLELALKELAALTHQRCGAVVTTQFALNGVVFPAATEQALYRVTQEALDNAVRHASARNMSLTLTADKRGAKLQIVDDGAGFDVVEARGRSGHFGLNGLIERVESLGGHVTIDSQPHAGTRILVEIANDHSRIAV
jgi:signal transduction histidine kinase